MALRLGDVATDFTQELTEGTTHSLDWIDGKWVVLKAKFLIGCKVLLTYLRMTLQPNKIMAESRYTACAS